MFGTSSFVTLDHLRLHVRRRPGSGRQLVLLHGLSDSCACWSPVVSALGTEYDIVAYDLRAHGESDAPEAGYAPVDHARDLLALLEALKLRSPVVIGHSLGAETAAFASTLAKGPIAGLVLEDPPWVSSWIDATVEERWASIADWKNDVATLQSMAEREAWLKARRDNATWSEDELRPWLESKRQMRLVGFESAVAARSDWRHVVDAIPCETLLLTADVAKWGLVTPEIGSEAARRNPKLRWVQLLEAGHGIHRDCLERYLDLVRGFLRDIPWNRAG